MQQVGTGKIGGENIEINKLAIKMSNQILSYIRF